jgi:hypothetical protein
MKSRTAITALFLLAAAYDGVLGLAFLVAHDAVFQWFNVTPPNHPGYVQFPAALLIVFAIMFAAVARNPEANRNLIPYGMLLKVSYCGVAFWHWFQAGLPNMWKPWAIADFAFLVLFFAAYRRLRV